MDVVAADNFVERKKVSIFPIALNQFYPPRRMGDLLTLSHLTSSAASR
jgi:hypothetical protein